MSNLEIVETQDIIIKMQSGVIRELYGLLLQHISAEEAEELMVTNNINEAARLAAWLDRGGEKDGKHEST
jgi:hypothetical protein